MSTTAEIMTARAISEFDHLVAEREREIRATMKAAGAANYEIAAYIAGCRPSLDEQRAGIGRMVSIELMKAGVSIGGVNDNVLS